MVLIVMKECGYDCFCESLLLGLFVVRGCS